MGLILLLVLFELFFGVLREAVEALVEIVAAALHLKRYDLRFIIVALVEAMLDLHRAVRLRCLCDPENLLPLLASDIPFEIRQASVEVMHRELVLRVEVDVVHVHALAGVLELFEADSLDALMLEVGRECLRVLAVGGSDMVDHVESLLLCVHMHAPVSSAEDLSRQLLLELDRGEHLR